MTGVASPGTTGDRAAFRSHTMTYSVSQADLVRDREAVLRVWRDNISWFSPDEHTRRFDWYLQNPYGPNKIFLVRDSAGSAIGTCGIALRAIDLGGRQMTAGNAVDIGVDEGHRTVQPALLLARAVAGCLSAEIPLIWVYPNDKAAGVFLRAGFKTEGQGDSYIKRLSFLPSLQRRGIPKPFDRLAAGALDLGLRLASRSSITSTSRVQPIKANDSGLAELLLSDSSRSLINYVRTPQLLHWLYEESPYRRYVLFGVRREASPHIGAAAVCYSRNGNAIIDDLVYFPERRYLEELISGVLAWARQERCFSLSMYLVNADELLIETLTSFGFYPDPSRPLLLRTHSSLPPDFRICGVPQHRNGSPYHLSPSPASSDTAGDKVTVTAH